MRVTFMKVTFRKEKPTNEIEKVVVKILKDNFLFEVAWLWQVEAVLGKLHYEKNNLGMSNWLHLYV